MPGAMEGKPVSFTVIAHLETACCLGDLVMPGVMEEKPVSYTVIADLETACCLVDRK